MGLLVSIIIHPACLSCYLHVFSDAAASLPVVKAFASSLFITVAGQLFDGREEAETRMPERVDAAG